MVAARGMRTGGDGAPGKCRAPDGGPRAGRVRHRSLPPPARGGRGRGRRAPDAGVCSQWRPCFSPRPARPPSLWPWPSQTRRLSGGATRRPRRARAAQQHGGLRSTPPVGALTPVSTVTRDACRRHASQRRRQQRRQQRRQFLGLKH